MLRALSIAGASVGRFLEARLQLFAAELKYEQLRFIRCFCFCFAGVLLLCTALITATILVVFSVDEEHRTTALLIATATHLAIGAICIGVALRVGYRGRPPFKSTTDALKEDGECLVSLIRK